jgi:hypothetical protein
MNRETRRLVIVAVVLIVAVAVVAYLLRNQPVNPCCG